jgi:hypothetical protein
MLLRWAFASLIAMLLLLGLAFASPARAQTAAAPAAPVPGGAFASLSPGGQKIARALFEAQRPAGTTTTAKPLTLEEIAARKQAGEGWGRVFKDMKAQGLVQDKTLGQVVSRHYRAPRGPVVTAGGRRFDEDGRREGVGRHRDDDETDEGARLGRAEHAYARGGGDNHGRHESGGRGGK